MANPIDLIVTQDALKQVDSLISKVTLAREGLLELGNAALGSSKNVAKITTPSGLANNGAANAQINAEIKKHTAEVEKLHAVIAKAAEKSRLAEIKLQQAREKSFDTFERNAKKETALAEKNANAYNKTQAQINRLTVVYNDLALKKQRYNNLSVNEEMRLATLSKVTEKYNGILKATDAQVGKNQRNVGNYASGYNALGNSINQLSREAPAFANSVNTGFMALSNNFPALFDAINGIRRQNALLTAEGKPTVSMFKQLAAAVFSWQTLLSIGVTLLTLYGGKIVSWVGSMMSANKGLQSLAENQKQLNEALKESSGSYAEQKVNIDVLYKTATDLNTSYKDRKRAVDELQELYPFYFKNLSDEAIMTGQAKDQYNLLSQAIVTVAKARASEEILQKRESERLVKEEQDNEKRLKKLKELANAKGTTSYVSGGGSVAGSGTSSIQETATQQKARLRKEILQIRDESVKQREQWAKEDAFFIAKVMQGNAIEQTLAPVDTKIDKTEDDRLKAQAERLKKELELQLAHIDAKLNNEDLYYTDRLTALDADFIKRVEIAKVDFDEELRLSKGNQDKQKTALINFQLEKIKLIENYTKQKNALEALDLDPVSKMATSKSETDPLKQLAESGKLASKELQQSAEDAEKLRKKLQQLKEATDNWMSSFSSEFLQNSGMDSLDTFFKQIKGEDGKMTTVFDELMKGAEGAEERFAIAFNAISESAQQAFNLISSFSQSNFEGEKKRIEEQQAIAISYAGGSATAINKINEDAEKRKKSIANRENKAKQKMALFNIGIDMAQGIVSALASTPPNIPLSIAIGAIGALQLGFVASQKIPQYFDGTDNHTGGLMLVNDGKGANYQEKVIFPNGKEITPQGRNVLMNAPAGTKVLTHEQQLFEMMQSNGINMTANYNKSNGMTANQMDVILGKHFSNIKTHNTTFDGNGFKSYIQNGNSRTISTANRVSGSGISV